MKKLTLPIFILLSLISFSQEKEIKEAFNLYDSGNKPQAQALIQQTESTITANISIIEPNVYAKYLYVKGSSLLEQDKTREAAQVFSLLAVYENGPVYSLKNKDTKEKIFVLSKSEATKLQAQGFSGLKETRSGTDYLQKLLPVLDEKRQAVNDKATEEYKTKDYSQAAEDFMEAHYLYKASGGDDIYKFYAATAYYGANNNEKALSLYQELIADGYTGKKTIYTVLQNGKRVGLTEEQYNSFKSAPTPDLTDFKKEETPSVESDIYNYTVSLLSTEKKYEEALALAQKGLSKLPGDVNLNNQIGELYYRTGQTEKYITRLKEVIQKNPQDYVSLYNLGVLYSKDPKTHDLAKEYYNKALAVKPDYVSANLNLASLILEPDEDIVKKMNALGNSQADLKEYDILLQQRKDLSQEALPYLEKAYQYDKNNQSIILSLEQTYKILQMKDKLEEIRKAKTSN